MTKTGREGARRFLNLAGPLLAAAVILLALPAGLGAAGTDEEPLAERVLWYPNDPARAFFIPEAVLQRVPVIDLPLDEYGKSGLTSRLERAQSQEELNRACLAGDAEVCIHLVPLDAMIARAFDEPGARRESRTDEQREGLRRILERHFRKAREQYLRDGPSPCWKIVSSHGSYRSRPDPFDFEEKFRSRELAFLGTVVETVPGWNDWSDREVEMVYLEVAEVFRDASSHLWRGRVVAFDREWGTLHVDGLRICTIPQTAFTPLAPGDPVLVFADPYGPADPYLAGATAYPVVEGWVLPQPYVSEAEVQPVPLEDFRSLLTTPLPPEGPGPPATPSVPGACSSPEVTQEAQE